MGTKAMMMISAHIAARAIRLVGANLAIVAERATSSFRCLANASKTSRDARNTKPVSLELSPRGTMTVLMADRSTACTRYAPAAKARMRTAHMAPQPNERRARGRGARGRARDLDRVGAAVSGVGHVDRPLAPVEVTELVPAGG